jgi:hypothetical protein
VRHRVLRFPSMQPVTGPIPSWLSGLSAGDSTDGVSALVRRSRDRVTGTGHGSGEHVLAVVNAQPEALTATLLSL